MPHASDPAADAARLAAVQLDGKRFAHPDWWQIREDLADLASDRQHTRCCDFARA